MQKLITNFTKSRLFRTPNLNQTLLRNFSVQTGSQFPSAIVAVLKYSAEEGYSNEIVDIQEYLENKKVVFIGYPGAYTPSCTNAHLPQFIQDSDKIKAQGIDEIIAMSVNDPFVLQFFAEAIGAKDKLTLVADGNGDLTKALGLEIDLSEVLLGNCRSVRFTMIVKDNVIKEINNEGGGKFTETSCALRIQNQLKELKDL
ncbi:peroxiredoxin [Stylonychia lemnae]|uniref:Peroxiredoxin n=1 Tax=Stylonychia lemnae TaxID=5949 RepID=A0A077ZS40_STYLE|nr:peroxiredoxin [Stylonychia lemnae]|eukprot:CDW72299.1 peroxiredoxin [Stylonychia lemnae]